MKNVRRLVMLAVHIQQCPGPDLSPIYLLEEMLHPKWLHQKKVQLRLSAVLLHAVNEKIVRVQLVGHHQIINSRHGANYRVPASGLSILLIERELVRKRVEDAKGVCDTVTPASVPATVRCGLKVCLLRL